MTIFSGVGDRHKSGYNEQESTPPFAAMGSNYRANGFIIKERSHLSTQTQILIYLALLAVFDAVIPIPITAMALIMILFQKPRWFKDWVDKIYK